MLPVLYRFTFESTAAQVVLLLIAVGLVAYAAWSGWRNAVGHDKDGKEIEPTRAERVSRARWYALFAVILAAVGLKYALPPSVFPTLPILGAGKGEGVPLHTYGILIGLGFISAVTVAGWLSQREWPGELGLRRRDQLFDLAFYVFLAAMVGSRILFIIVNWHDYAENPASMFSIGGGLVFQGGLIGASAAAYWYAKKHGMEFARLSDVALPTVSLGSAFGRLGCFSAGCCWGDIAPEGSKFVLHFPGNAKNLFGQLSGMPALAFSSQADSTKYVVLKTGEVVDQMVPGAERIADWAHTHGHTLGVYPTQLIDSLGNLSLFALMLVLRRYRRFHGQIAGMWLIGYAILRTSVELFRGDAERGTLKGLFADLGMTGLSEKLAFNAWYNISTAQFINLGIFALGAWLLISGIRKLKAQPTLDVAALAEPQPG